jgi:autotransporter-associated beta strand protein
MKTFRPLLAAASSFLLLSPLIGAPIPITDATYSGSFAAGTPENITGNATVTGLTTSEGTFSNLIGATANGTVSSQINNSLGTAPATKDAAVSGLSVNDGINNLSATTTGNNFQLGAPINSNTRFFIIESAPVSGTIGDAVTVTLINASNATVGTYTLSLSASQFTSSVAGNSSTALATLQYTAGIPANTANPSKLGGVTFSLADFTGSGDLSTVTGIRLSSSDALDPNVVGAFSVPLPITDATYTGSFTAGTPEAITGPATVSSITTAEGTFSNLIGATANGITSIVQPSSVGTTPSNDQAGRNLAATGLTANDAVQNLGSGNFQFSSGTPFDFNTRFFIFDTTPKGSTAGDDATVQLIDSANNVVGSFSFNLLASSFTSTPANTTNTALATLTYTQNPNSNFDSKLGGVSFSLSNLGVTAATVASTSSATGIRLVSSGLDPSVVGLYAVPAATPTPTPTPTPSGTPILFVGNSFTHGNNEPAISYNNANITDENGTGYGGVPGIFKKLTTQAGLNYAVSIEAVSAETLSWHYANKAAIIGQSKWQIVVLQELSTGPLPTAHGGNPSDFYAGADNLQNLVLANNSAAKILLYETWTSPASASNQNYNGVLQAMQDDLTSAYFNAFYTFGFTTVARVGDAFMRCVDQGLADPNNSGAPGTFNIWSTADNRHASQYGSYLSAAIFFEKITGLDPRTLSVASGSAASDLGISATDGANLNRIAYEITALPDPTPAPAPASPNTLQSSGSTLNWNTSASWVEGTALASSSAVLINSSSADNSIVANSVDGNNHPAFIQTLSFDIGANTKNLQGNATVTTDRALRLVGGTDALGGTDLLHLSGATTGTVNIGTNSGLGNLLLSFLNPGSIDVENPSARLNMGPTVVLSGAVNVTKTGFGTLTLAGANTFGSGTGNTFTISTGTVLANTAVSGTQSATGVGNVVVSANSTLGGIGQITPGTGNQISVSSGGFLAPGAGIGTLTINGANTSAPVLAMTAGAKLQFELNSNGPGNLQSDEIALLNGATGDIAFGGNSITFTDLSFGGLPQGTYPLFTATAGDNYGGLTTDGSGFITAGLTLGTGVESYSANLQVAGANLVLNLSPKPYTSWKSQHFTLAERSDPNISGDLATPAGDGIANLLKYALNLDPHLSGASGLPTAGTMTAADNMQYLTLTYREVISATDLSYVVEVGGDLAAWNFGSAFTDVVSSSNDPNGITRTVVVRDLTPITGGSHHFMRLRVTKS